MRVVKAAKGHGAFRISNVVLLVSELCTRIFVEHSDSTVRLKWNLLYTYMAILYDAKLGRWWLKGTRFLIAY